MIVWLNSADHLCLTQAADKPLERGGLQKEVLEALLNPVFSLEVRGHLKNDKSSKVSVMDEKTAPQKALAEAANTHSIGNIYS